MDPITQIPILPTVVGITLCSEWFARRNDEYHTYPKEIPLHEKPGQAEELLYWYDLTAMHAYLAGDLALPVCPACGREATKCSQDRSLPCDPVPLPYRNRGTSPRYIWPPVPVENT